MEAKLNVKLIAHTMNPELVIACAGKLCYSPVGVEQLLEKQTEKDIERFVNMLVNLGHESPLEHCSFTFAIEGVSRALTHQLVRHRLASYSQQSQRYVREEQFEYVVPKDIKECESAYRVYVNHMIKTQTDYDAITDLLLFDYLDCPQYSKDLRRACKRVNEDYALVCQWFCYQLDITDPSGEEGEYSLEDKRLILSKMLEKYPKVVNNLIKKAIENARYVLPNGAETKIVVTMNLRSLINFVHHRKCRRAQEEIQGLAVAMVEEIEKVSPLLAKCLGAPCQFGVCPEGVMTCGEPFIKVTK